MDHLPDDVLLSVMSHLDLPDLITCRLACKRFASLALHPDVWRDECLREPLFHREYFNRLFCPVLRLAPCQDLLTISLPCHLTCHPLFSGSCAARRLHINVLEGGAAHAALLIRHQRELGRLKGVELYIEKVPSKVDSPLLFETLAATPGLDYLEITPGGEEFLPLDCSPRSLQPTAPASLRSFTCPLDQTVVHFFNFMLAGHAATLEEVNMLSYYDVPSPLTTALLLAKMHNLTYLQCPVFAEMQAVAGCASLRSLRLEISPGWPDDQAHAPAAAALLRRAHQLISVDFKYNCFDPDEQGLLTGVELIMAMASSGRSGLEELSIDHDFADKTNMLPLLSELRRALPSLPSLRYFKVNLQRDAFVVEVEDILAEKPSLYVELDS